VSCKLVALLALVGCYADLRPGLSAPGGHGHGGAGTDLDVAFGGEHVDETLRIGGGIATGARIADGNGYVPVGVDGHVAAQLTPYIAGKRLNWLVAAHASVGYARGLSQAPSGIFNAAFAGIGLGSTIEQPDSRVPRGHVAIGPAATWFRSDAGNSYWFLGGAIEISLGFSR
jgi:hypothetical protein